jgi:hypothetical protein
MNVWANAVITEKGLALMAKLTQGNTLDIVDAVVGAGFVVPGVLQKQTEVTDPKQTLKARPVSYPETGRCDLPLTMTNEGLTTGYEATQIGVFANDPDDGKILFFIAQSVTADIGTTVPSETEMPGYCVEWTFQLQYGQADGVNVIVDPSNTVSPAEMIEYVNCEVDTKIATAKEDILEEAATAAGEALKARVGNIPANTTIRSYIDTAVGSGGTASASAIAAAKQEAIAASKTYTDAALTANIVPATGDGKAYTATVPNVTELKKGLIITIIPDTTSSATIPTLNVNGLGKKNIKQRLSTNTSLTAEAATDSWMVANKPVPLMYDGSLWVTITGRPAATALYGKTPIKNGGTNAETAAEALINLGAQAQHTIVTVILLARGWTNNTQTVSAKGATETNTVLVGPHPDSHTEYSEYNVRCTGQGNGTLTFTCESAPSADVQANVIFLE